MFWTDFEPSVCLYNLIEAVPEMVFFIPRDQDDQKDFSFSFHNNQISFQNNKLISL